MWLTEFTAVRLELIAIQKYDRIFLESKAPAGNEEGFAYMFRQARRNELLKQFADLVARN